MDWMTESQVELERRNCSNFCAVSMSILPTPIVRKFDLRTAFGPPGENRAGLAGPALSFDAVRLKPSFDPKILSPDCFGRVSGT